MLWRTPRDARRTGHMDQFEMQQTVEEELATLASSLPVAFLTSEDPHKPLQAPEPFDLDGTRIRMFIIDADYFGQLVWMVRFDHRSHRKNWRAWVRRCDEYSPSGGLSVYSSVSKDRAQETGLRLVELGQNRWIVEFDGDVETAAAWLKKHSRDGGYDYRQFLTAKEASLKGLIGKLLS
jgi:hypothetical protein